MEFFLNFFFWTSSDLAKELEWVFAAELLVTGEGPQGFARAEPRAGVPRTGPGPSQNEENALGFLPGEALPGASLEAFSIRHFQ